MAENENVTTSAEEAIEGGVPADVPEAIGLDASLIANFPSNPEVAPKDDSLPPLPKLTDDDTPVDGEGDELDATAGGQPEPEPEKKPAAKTPEPEKKDEGTTVETEKPEKPFWDKEKQKSDEKAADERKRREAAEQHAQQLEARLSELEKQVKSGTAQTANDAESELAELDLSFLDEEDEYVEPSKEVKALKAMASKLTESIQTSRALQERLAGIDQTVQTRAKEEQRIADRQAYESLLNTACKGREHIRNALVKAINDEARQSGYSADNMPTAREVTWMVQAKANELALTMPAPQKRAAAPKNQPKAPHPGVRANAQGAQPIVTRGMTTRQYAELHKDEILGR
jgi:hypothetical protein